MAAAPQANNPLLHFEQDKWDQLRTKEIQDTDLVYLGQKLASVYCSTDDLATCLNLSAVEKEAVLHEGALECELHVQIRRLLAEWRQAASSSPVTWDALIVCLLSLNESTRDFIVKAIKQHLFTSTGSYDNSRGISLSPKAKQKSDVQLYLYVDLQFYPNLLLFTVPALTHYTVAVEETHEQMGRL